jgi:hypothetical protein
MLVGAMPTSAHIVLGVYSMGEGCGAEWSLQPHGRGQLIALERKGTSCDGEVPHQRFDMLGNEIK